MPSDRSREHLIVAVSGDVASGKSTVSRAVAEALGLRWMSTGDLQRKAAEQRGITTLELNRLAETDRSFDDAIDSMLKDLARADEPLVIDSRLAWHFIPQAIKVHLVVDLDVAADRAVGRGKVAAEEYATHREAVASVRERVRSERQRFSKLYNVDIGRLHNYDVVVDTSAASSDEIVEHVLDFVARRVRGDVATVPELYLSPRRLRPSAHPDAPDATTATDAISVFYVAPDFYVVGGLPLVDAAVRADATLVPAILSGEGELRAIG
jgi:predicted cytidylate kinase